MNDTFVGKHGGEHRQVVAWMIPSAGGSMNEISIGPAGMIVLMCGMNKRTGKRWHG